MNKLTIILPVHNRRYFTEKCLICLQKQTVPDFEVVVVDDGSTDGTRGMLETDFPDVVRLEGDGSLWWTGGINMGVKYALESGADLIVTLNNDVILKVDYIERMLSAHQREPNALICSMNLSQEMPARLLFAGIKSYNHWTAKTIKTRSCFESVR